MSDKRPGSHEDHGYNRRGTDLNVASLSLRVGVLETRMATVESDLKINTTELKANTRLTEEIHGQSAEIFELFKAARNGFRMLTGIGNFGLRVVEITGKYAMPLFWIVALIAALVMYVKTGSWRMPEWWTK